MSDNEKVFLGHTTAIPSTSIIRPNDATPYTAGDVIGTVAGVGSISVLDFAGSGRSNGGAGMINGAVLVDSANQATPPSLELWLFNAAPAQAQDNSPCAFSDAELAALIGIIPLTTFRQGNVAAGVAGNGVIQSDVTMISFRCSPATTHLYGVLIVRNAYTPVVTEQFTVLLTILQDY